MFSQSLVCLQPLEAVCSARYIAHFLACHTYVLPVNKGIFQRLNNFLIFRPVLFNLRANSFNLSSFFPLVSFPSSFYHIHYVYVAIVLGVINFIVHFLLWQGARLRQRYKFLPFLVFIMLKSLVRDEEIGAGYCRILRPGLGLGYILGRLRKKA